MSKIRKIEKGNYYHNYSRGVNKRIIFLDEYDYCAFQKMIENFNTNTPFRSRSSRPSSRPERGNSDKLVHIYCYTLMPNHFHFILKEIKEKGISLFFQKILGQYSQYFNKKYNRRGPLFESRFKDKIVENDQYFEHLITYIWNNPIKIINPSYVSKDLLNGKIELSEQEKVFANTYPYKFFCEEAQLSRSGRDV